MNIRSSKYVLLTGAGFTKNYGTLLANEMWSQIFNHKEIQGRQNILNLMKVNFDYEEVYNTIMEESSYTTREKKAINDAMKSAYDYIDKILIELLNMPGYPEDTLSVCDLIYKFYHAGTKNFIFTLNQDLFFERLYFDSNLSIPGIKKNPKWFEEFKDTLETSDYCWLPQEDELNQNESNILSDGDFFLIKLHGSCNWKSFDGSQKMVIGRGKKEQIQKEPLLKYYFNIFENVLLQNQCRLLIIGYGFADDHINEILSKSVKENRLMIYVISPKLPEEFKKELLDKEHGEGIWQGISGYFPYNLEKMFSKKLGEHQTIKNNFYEVFFD